MQKRKLFTFDVFIMSKSCNSTCIALKVNAQSKVSS